MNSDIRLSWAAVDFLTPKRISQLEKHFQNLENAWIYFSVSEFISAGIPQRSVLSLEQKYQQLNGDIVRKSFERSGARLIFWRDPDFPEILKNIPDPPIFLFVKGEIIPADSIALAVVGTRKASAQGRRTVEFLLPDLVRAGFTIVSGMARGIDVEAHRVALRNHGRTLAVWGTGIDVMYPQENGQLVQEIMAHGAIISEFPLGTQAESYNFPRRNRLISGLALGTLVIEGEEKSGSLITAALALEQGKEVFAVPGSLLARLSEGPNRLIQRGEAKLVQTSEDILNEFSFVQKVEHPQKFFPENELERLIFETLTKEPMDFDQLVFSSKRSGAELSAALMLLSMKGVVSDLGMNQWARNF